jgi:hypothetical protein
MKAIPVNQKIIVRVNMKQKDEIKVGDTLVKMALKYEKNHREKSPVVAEVVHGNDLIKTGQIICTHHNHFYPPSPYFLYDDLFSIPCNKTIFGVFDSAGHLIPVCGNMVCQTVDIETPLPVPPEQRKKHIDRYVIQDPGWTVYKKEQTVFTRPYSGYEIVYVWQNIERRVIKVDSEMVCGVLG